MDSNPTPSNVKLPRIAITYCTQCRWMLRAGYFGQELLSTFGTSVGEIALIPATGGIFTVHLTYEPQDADGSEATEVLLWDRKAEGGFPETKILKQRVRNCIEPGRDLGHSDTPASKPRGNAVEGKEAEEATKGTRDLPVMAKQQPPGASAQAERCEDCG